MKMSSKSNATKQSKAVIGLVAVVLLLTVYGLLKSSRRSRVALASGRFHQVAHKGTGEAILCRMPEGKLELCLVDFRTHPGADLEVRLIAAPDAFENETVEKSDFISLGTLTSAQGDQSYSVPDDLDFTRFSAVTIWSRKYRVNFTTAPLRPL